jgi:hypothetical protein
MNRQYENYYGVQILNDLHNYFPEILYGTRFQNDQLVQYIRSQVANRFNLYTNAQTNYFNQNRTNLQNQQVNRVNSMYDEGADIPNVNILFSGSNPLSSIIQSLVQGLNTPLSDSDDIMNMNSLLPVVIRPTLQQIEGASAIVEISNSQESCAICQELMNPSDRIRRLNQCRHMFHNNCILTAFSSSPRCPVCRNDIRS